jgi:hypothetical protein
LGQLRRCNVVFAWICCGETIGTVAEVALARALEIPVFIVFLTGELAESFYFIAELANASTVASSLEDAWMLFECWCEKEENRSWWRRELKKSLARAV